MQKTSHIPRGWHEQRSSPETTNSNDRRARRVQCFERVLRHRSHLVFFSLSVGSSLPENQNKNKIRSVACTQVTIPAPFNIGRSIKSRATVPQQTTQTGSSSNNNRSRAQVFVGLHDDDDEPPSHLIAPLGRLALDNLRRSTTSIKKQKKSSSIDDQGVSPQSTSITVPTMKKQMKSKLFCRAKSLPQSMVKNIDVVF